MSIITARPPNFEQILAAFPGAADDGVIFAYGEDVYVPSGFVVPIALLKHERVHQKRQQDNTMPDIWWGRYIADQKFRYAEELAAHAAEYRAQLSHLDRNQKAKLLQATATRLIAPLYKYEPARSLSQALYDLRWELDR